MARSSNTPDTAEAFEKRLPGFEVEEFAHPLGDGRNALVAYAHRRGDNPARLTISYADAFDPNRKTVQTVTLETSDGYEHIGEASDSLTTAEAIEVAIEAAESVADE